MEIVFGFILSIWYSTIPSFLTTFLREPQISTLQQLKNANVKIFLMDNSSTRTYGYKLISDIIAVRPQEEVVQAIEKKNHSYGHIITSDIYELSKFPLYYCLIKDYNLETGYLKILWSMTSYYKKLFDRYIDIVHDTGLYEHWKGDFYREAQKYNSSDIFFPLRRNGEIVENALRILNIDYFICPLVFLVIGYSIGFLNFIMEVSWKKCKRFF